MSERVRGVEATLTIGDRTYPIKSLTYERRPRVDADRPSGVRPVMRASYDWDDASPSAVGREKPGQWPTQPQHPQAPQPKPAAPKPTPFPTTTPKGPKR